MDLQNAPYSCDPTSETPRQPLFSLVVPLHDDRGVALQAIDGWLCQRTESTPFELIVVDTGKPSLARKIARRLGPNDHLLSAESFNEAYLYNLGAGAATSEWIVFSEAHVVPSPDAVANLSRHLESATCDAATLGSDHRTRSHLSRVDAELHEHESDSMRKLGLWRTVGLRGFVIRRCVFDELGAFNEDYFRFAETAMALRIVDGGYILDEFSDVVMEHWDTDTLHELRIAMSTGRLGEHRFRALEPSLACDYFQSSCPSLPRECIAPGAAKALWLQILRATMNGKLQASLRLFRVSRSSWFTALTGWQGEICRAMIRVYLCYWSLWVRLHLTRKVNANYKPFLDQYLTLRERCAAVGSIRFRSETSLLKKGDSKGQYLFPMVVEGESLDEAGLNFFPAETWQGETYCWSSPGAAICLPLDSSEHRIVLDARPTGGWLVRIPKLCLNGTPIPKKDISENGGILQVTIRADTYRGAGTAILSWDCVPFCPSDSGLPDNRQLGVALIRVQVEKVQTLTNPLEIVRAA